MPPTTTIFCGSQGRLAGRHTKSAVPCRGRECPSRGQCATVDDRPHIALAPVAAGTPGAPAPLAKSHAAVSGACLHHPRHICRQTSTGLTCSCKTHPYPPRLITTTQPSTPPSKNRQLLPPTQLGPITLAGPNTTLSLPAAHCSRGAQLLEAALNHYTAVMVGIFIAIDAATPLMMPIMAAAKAGLALPNSQHREKRWPARRVIPY